MQPWHRTLFENLNFLSVISCVTLVYTLDVERIEAECEVSGITKVNFLVKISKTRTYIFDLPDT